MVAGRRVVNRIHQHLRKRIKLIYSPETIGEQISYCYGKLGELSESPDTRHYCGLCEKVRAVSIVLPEQIQCLYYLTYSPQKDKWLVYHQDERLCDGSSIHDPVLTTRFARSVSRKALYYDQESRYYGYFQPTEEYCRLRPLYYQHPDRTLCRAMQSQALDIGKIESGQYDLSRGFILVSQNGLVHYNSRDPIVFFMGLLRPFQGEDTQRARQEALEVLAEVVPDVVVEFMKTLGKIPGGQAHEEQLVFLPRVCEEIIDEIVEIFRCLRPSVYSTLRRNHSSVGYFRLLDWFRSYHEIDRRGEAVTRSDIADYMSRSRFTFSDGLSRLLRDALVEREEFIEVCRPLLDHLVNPRIDSISWALDVLGN